MKLEPEQTPDSYSTIECVKEYDGGIKVFRNQNKAGEVFFHISREPEDIQEITSPDDIETLRAFQVLPSEDEWDVVQEVNEELEDILFKDL